MTQDTSHHFNDQTEEPYLRRLAWKEQSIAALEKRLKADLGEDWHDDAAILSIGSHGATMDHGNGALSKLFLSGENIDERRAFFHNEADIYKRVSDRMFGSAKTPKLFSAGSLIGSQEVIGTIRMEKLEGDELDWRDFVESAKIKDIEHHFRNVGQVLAAFHTDTQALLDDVTVPEKELKFGSSVGQVVLFDHDVNLALSRCNDYLQANMEAGSCHGDFHPLNCKVNKNLEITGLFDLSFSGPHENYLVDFVNLPDEGMDYAIEEYEQATGKVVNRDALLMTQISQDVAVINYWQGRDESRAKEIIPEKTQALFERLNRVGHITQIRFDTDNLPQLAT